MMTAEQTDVHGELRTNEPMSKHTSWRVGGPADSFFVPASIDDLSLFLQELDPSVPVFWFGVGSNLLVRDGGIRGVVIAAARILRNLEKVDHYVVRAGSGVPCTQLARQCIRWELGPSEFFGGIPGTVGGALAMNAGAHGGETWERVESVRTIDRCGEIHERAPREYSVAYRSGKATQPLGLPSCGSVFRNPRGDHAARLIDAAGLKGYSIGGAEVSEKHANFIINKGNATATDVEELIEHVRQTVIEAHGIELVHEVRIVGEVAQ
jgi:UDP-N-acetylmuramate dehydrogenase